jgi:hypothetical protein
MLFFEGYALCISIYRVLLENEGQGWFKWWIVFSLILDHVTILPPSHHHHFKFYFMKNEFEKINWNATENTLHNN